MSPAPGDCFLARVGDRGLDSLAAGPFTVALSPREQRQRVAAIGPGRGRRSLAASVEPGDVLSLCAGDDGSVALDRRPWAEGAAVVLENATGRVLALVGGLEPTQGGYVRATHARRQPGSTFKTFVYAAALKDGLSPLDRVWPPAPRTGMSRRSPPDRPCATRSPAASTRRPCTSTAAGRRGRCGTSPRRWA